MSRTVGNRRTPEEALKFDKEQLATTYKLEEQEDFKGTPEELEYMQYVERRYFDTRPLMTDEEFDALKNKYNYKETLEAVAPSGRNVVKLLAPLVSLDKAGNKGDFENFMKRSSHIKEFETEVKLDGLTGSVIYDYNEDSGKYEYKEIVSRGGMHGMAFNKEAFYGVNTNIPKTIDPELINIYYKDGNHPKRIELRGELVIPIIPETMKRYCKFNEVTGNYEEPVWRSIASGMATRKVPQNVKGLLEVMYQEDQDNVLESEKYFSFNTANSRRVYQLIPIEFLVEQARKFYEDEEYDRPLRFGRTWSTLVDKTNNDIMVVDKDGKEIFTYPGQLLEEYLDIVFYSMAVDGANLDIPITSDAPGTFKYLVENMDIKHVSNIEFRFDKRKELKDYKKTYNITSDKHEIVRAILDFYGCEEHKILTDEGERTVWKRNEKLPRLRNLYEYAMDGVVIKPTNSSMDTQGLDQRIGRNGKVVVGHHPQDQIAVKLRSEVIKDVYIQELKYNTTSLKNVTVSAVLDHPYRSESGSMVSSVNLYNKEWLELNPWVEEAMNNHQPLELIMSMDIIPIFINPHTGIPSNGIDL